MIARRCWVSASVALLLAACAGDNRPPILVSAAPLDYPERARVDEVGGQVTLAYDITIQGTVENIRVVSADPPGVFDAAAIKSLAAWRFTPAQREGRAIRVNKVSTLTFQLGETDEYDRH